MKLYFLDLWKFIRYSTKIQKNWFFFHILYVCPIFLYIMTLFYVIEHLIRRRALILSVSSLELLSQSTRIRKKYSISWPCVQCVQSIIQYTWLRIEQTYLRLGYDSHAAETQWYSCADGRWHRNTTVHSTDVLLHLPTAQVPSAKSSLLRTWVSLLRTKPSALSCMERSA